MPSPLRRRGSPTPPPTPAVARFASAAVSRIAAGIHNRYRGRGRVQRTGRRRPPRSGRLDRPGRPPAEPWKSLAFTNGWTNYGGDTWELAAYRKDQVGI